MLTACSTCEGSLRIPAAGHWHLDGEIPRTGPGRQLQAGEIECVEHSDTQHDGRKQPENNRVSVPASDKRKQKKILDGGERDFWRIGSWVDETECEDGQCG